MTKICAAVITVSDRCSRGEQQDKSGDLVVELLHELDAEIVLREILSDDLDPLAERLRVLADRPDINLILTTGGTGLSPRDNTPEATRRIIEKEAPGLAEAMRLHTFVQTPTSILSRAVCGTRNDCLIINLPGSLNGVRECFEIVKPVLSHAVALLAGKPHDDAD